jgi:predicted PurR-regulated permease PerM
MNSTKAMEIDPDVLTRAVEVTIRLGLIGILVAWCFGITRPFIIPVVWGIIIATAVYPAFQWVEGRIGGRTRSAATLFVLLGFALLAAPALMFSGSLIESAQWLATGLQSGTLEVPPPPVSVADWPVIGEPVNRFWTLASVNMEAAVRQVGPQLAQVGSTLLSAVAGVVLGIVQFAISIAIAGVLLASGTGGYQTAQSIAARLAGERGEALADLAGATVKNVAQGILGVALIQSALIGVGLFVAGVPHAALWTLMCLMLAVVQLPPLLVVVPLIVYVFSAASTPAAIAFTIWMLIAAFSDNVLKPVLLSRGLDLPMIVIFMGSIGGFMLSGFVGLFVGAVVLALGYELFAAWLGGIDEPDGVG